MSGFFDAVGRRVRGGVLVVSLALCGVARADSRAVLFVGNSFTYGHVAPTSSYGQSRVTDLNGQHYGGVPAIFKHFTEQAGLEYRVSLETVPGKTLGFHVKTHADVVAKSAWDVVVLQGLSTEPLPTNHDGHPDRYVADAATLRDLARTHNPNAAVYLYETWASPRGVRQQHYAPDEGGLRAMQDDLTAASFAAARQDRLTAVVRVGDAFRLALDRGLGTHVPFDAPTVVIEPAPTGPTTRPATTARAAGIEGAMDLWDSHDARHASPAGSYLSAALMYAKITGRDPRQLKAGPGTAAAALGLSPEQAGRLHALAYEVNAMPDPN